MKEDITATSAPIQRSGNIIHMNGIPRVNRFDEMSLELSIKTFGMQSSFVCKAINSSISGLLIASKDKNLPFQERTLIEVIVPANKNPDIESDLYFIAKVVRIDDRLVNQKTKCFGVQIVDIDESEMIIWKDHIYRIGSKSGHEANANLQQGVSAA